MDQLRTFIDHLKETFPATTFPRPAKELFAHLSETFLPHTFRLLQKDNKLFSEVDLFPNVRIESLSAEGWFKFQMSVLYATLQDSPAETLKTLMGSLNDVLPGGKTKDEINEILNDEETNSALNDILEALLKTKFAYIIGDVAASIQYEEIGINFEDPNAILEMMKNPTGHPALKAVMEKAQAIFQQKFESGKINRTEFIREIEMLKAKCQSAFGKYLNEMLVGEGNTTGNTAGQILSGHPDARRARMLARLQKKLRKDR